MANICSLKDLGGRQACPGPPPALSSRALRLRRRSSPRARRPGRSRRPRSRCGPPPGKRARGRPSAGPSRCSPDEDMPKKRMRRVDAFFNLSGVPMCGPVLRLSFEELHAGHAHRPHLDAPPGQHFVSLQHKVNLGTPNSPEMLETPFTFWGGPLSKPGRSPGLAAGGHQDQVRHALAVGQDIATPMEAAGRCKLLTIQGGQRLPREDHGHGVLRD